MIVNKYPYFIAPTGQQSDQQFAAAAFNIQTGQSPHYNFQLHPSTLPPGTLYPIQQFQQQIRYQHPQALIPQQQDLKLNSDLNSAASSTESTSPASSSQSPGLVHKTVIQGSDDDKLNIKTENRKRQNFTNNNNKQNYDRQSNIIRAQSVNYQQHPQFFNESNRNLYLNTPPPGLTQQISLNENTGTCTPPPSLLSIPLLNNDLNVITNQKLLNNMKNQQMSPNINNSKNIFNKNETTSNKTSKQPLQPQQRSSNNTKITDTESKSASPSPNYNNNENGMSKQQQQITFINSALPLTTIYNPATGQQQFIQPSFIDIANDGNIYLQPVPPPATNNENNGSNRSSNGSNGVSTSSPAIGIPPNFVAYQTTNQSQYYNLIPVVPPNFTVLNQNNNNSNNSNSSLNNSNPNNNGSQVGIIQAYPAQHYLPNGSFKYPQHMFSAPNDLQFMSNHLIDNSFNENNFNLNNNINNNYIKNAHNTFQKKKSCYNCGSNHLGSECSEPTIESILLSNPSSGTFYYSHSIPAIQSRTV